MCFILIAQFFSLFFIYEYRDDKISMSYRNTYSHLFLIPAPTHMRITPVKRLKNPIMTTVLEIAKSITCATNMYL